MAIVPAMLEKTISFKRLNNRHVRGYKIYGLFKDNNYSSGIRRMLLDNFENPSEPNVDRTSVELKYNQNATWELPGDIFIDRDHKFKLFMNDSILTSLYYQYNKYTRLLTIDTNLKPININDRFRLEYYRDRIKRTYTLEDNCKIEVVPVYADTYTYGNHNIII